MFAVFDLAAGLRAPRGRYTCGGDYITTAMNYDLHIRAFFTRVPYVSIPFPSCRIDVV